MSYCHISRQIDDHIHGEYVVDSLNQKINARIERLMTPGADYYPFTRENIMEALGGLTDAQEIILQHTLEKGINEVGFMLSNWISQYWELQAEKKAIKELSQ